MPRFTEGIYDILEVGDRIYIVETGVKGVITKILEPSGYEVTLDDDSVEVFYAYELCPFSYWKD